MERGNLFGKYLDLPYWRIIPGAEPDPVVKDYVQRGWKYQMSREEQIKKVQELLFLHGYNDVSFTGKIDKKTTNEIDNFNRKMKCKDKCSNDIDFNLYSALYYTVPLDKKALQRRYAL